ncbi:Type IV fimbrial biogenesis protein, involved in pilus assembly [gamma proteobacterium HdN1]|nr:Type IV fimbrial biogenesis protein, involved in pilus assembly [gamma proteobacterium HdN1]
MARINLLPWREERRQELKKQFLTILVGVIFVGAGSVYVANMVVESETAYQNTRNEFVQAETRKLDEQIKEIAELKKKRASLIERMNVIQDLQGNRPMVVKVFDELARTMPDGVYYASITETGDTITADGVAESNTRISTLMRNLDDSGTFLRPTLSKVVKHAMKAGEQKDESDFQLSFKIEKPKSSDKEG